MKADQTITRRNFLQRTAAGAVATLGTPWVVPLRFSTPWPPVTGSTSVVSGRATWDLSICRA